MRKSLSNPTGLPLALNIKKGQPVDSIGERDQAWNVGISQDQYAYYYNIAENIAYLILGHYHEAEIVADKALDELWRRECPPSETEVEKHIRVLARCRALDYRDTPMHRLREKCRSLVWGNDDQDEYEAIPESSCTLGAEEEFFYEEEREQFAQRLAEVVSSLNDLQRACFVLRLVEHLKPEEIAKILNVSAETVSTQAYRARNKVKKLLIAKEKDP